MKKEKKKNKTRPAEEELKVEKLSRFRLKRIAMVILWIILAFIFLRGIIAIFTSVSPAEQKRIMEEYLTTLQAEESVQLEASTFAENFIRDYFTYNGSDKEDYEKRMANYTAAGITVTAPESSVVSVSNISVADINFVSDSDVDVDVTAVVNYPDTTKLITLRVPIEIDYEGNMAVVNLPQFVPVFEKSEEIDAYRKSLPGREVDKETLDTIQANLDNFFKTYYEGNENELSYYVTKDFPYRRGLESAVTFGVITALTVSYDDADDSYYAVVNLDVLDSGGRTLEQVVYLELKETDRFYVNNIGTR